MMKKIIVLLACILLVGCTHKTPTENVQSTPTVTQTPVAEETSEPTIEPSQTPVSETTEQTEEDMITLHSSFPNSEIKMTKEELDETFTKETLFDGQFVYYVRKELPEKVFVEINDTEFGKSIAVVYDEEIVPGYNQALIVYDVQDTLNVVMGDGAIVEWSEESSESTQNGYYCFFKEVNPTLEYVDGVEDYEAYFNLIAIRFPCDTE